MFCGLIVGDWVSERVAATAIVAQKLCLSINDTLTLYSELGEKKRFLFQTGPMFLVIENIGA